ncbi:MAG: ABC-type transport auxiliary lipoprotein family protein [Alphaproteobacteria bacterium]
MPAGAAFGALGACDLQLPGQGPPPRLFVLSPKSTFPEDLPTVDWQLTVEVPTAAANLDTTRISLQRASYEYQYYASANWTDRAPTLVQTLIIESFENSDRIVAVGRESLGLRADFVLKSELREFQEIYVGQPAGGAPEVHVRLVGRLVQMPQRAIVGAGSFERKIVAASDTLESIVAAFDEALGKVLKDLVVWALVTGEEVELLETRRNR